MHKVEKNLREPDEVVLKQQVYNTLEIINLSYFKEMPAVYYTVVYESS